MNRILNNNRRGTLRGLGALSVPSAGFTFSEPDIATATRVVEAWRNAVGITGNQVIVGNLDGDTTTTVVNVAGKTYAIRLAPANKGITPPAGMAPVLMGEFVAFVREMRPKATSEAPAPTPTPPPPTATPTPDGCPCRTETTVVQRTVVIPVRQTRVICDTPPPTTIVPPCDEVTAAVRQQLAAQGISGMGSIAPAQTTQVRPSRPTIAPTPSDAMPAMVQSSDGDTSTDWTPWIAAGAGALLLFIIIK
jgi:hypothetical protein